MAVLIAGAVGSACGRIGSGATRLPGSRHRGPALPDLTHRGPALPDLTHRGPAVPGASLPVRTFLGRALLGTVLFGTAACASLEPLPLRPEPVPYADTLPIREPNEREVVEAAERWRRGFIEEAGEAVRLDRLVGEEREALNLTHFDDVVPSAWFEPRNGARRMDLEAIRRGAATEPGPDTSGVLTVVAGKTGGAMPGFTVVDSRGDRYLLKFDPPGYRQLASSADVIASRFFYAAGYHTPADYVVTFRRDRLRLSPDAGVEEKGRERPMTVADVEAILDRADPLPDGRYLALASRFLPGVPKGPWFFRGRRRDDPNDHFRHEYRRELRGIWVLAAWLNHTDLVFQNTMDVWVDPPGYLRHYLLDFSSALGSSQIGPHNPREELEHDIDLWPTFARILTLGFFRMGWEGWRWEVIHPSIGWLPATGYEPNRWRPNWPNEAWRLVTPADGYWGAKLAASFTDDQIAAAVAAGELPAAAADTLVKILVFRRDRTVAYWYGRVTPVEDPVVEPPVEDPVVERHEAPGAPGPEAGFVLSFRDLGLARGLWDPAAVRYEWEFRGPTGVLWRGEAPAGAEERQAIRVAPPNPGDRADPNPCCPGALTPGGRSGAGAEGLWTLRLRSVRDGGQDGRPAVVYLRREEEGWKVVGLFH